MHLILFVRGRFRDHQIVDLYSTSFSLSRFVRFVRAFGHAGTCRYVYIYKHAAQVIARSTLAEEFEKVFIVPSSITPIHYFQAPYCITSAESQICLAKYLKKRQALPPLSKHTLLNQDIYLTYSLQLQFGGSTLGQYRTFLDPTNDLSPLELEFPDLLQSSWPKNDFLASSTLWSPGAFCNASFQDGTLDEDIFEKSLDGFFSTCAVSDIPCLDLSQAFSDPEPVPFDGEDLVSELNLEPSQLQTASGAIEANESFRHAVTSSPEPELCKKKKSSYTPAWKADSSAKTPKRPRKSAKTSKDTTPKSSKRSPTTSEPDNGAGSNSALRANHNLTEKLYRNRLNGQFETLLSALPPAHDAGDARNGEEKRVSKAEVLILAKEHIRALEQTRLELEKERTGLVDDVESLKGVWIGMNTERS